MKAQDMAKQAADILNQRGTDNGYDKGEERSAAKIAKVFNIVTGRDLTEQEAWLFMICLKLVREGGKHQLDNCLDLANYAFLRAESFDTPDPKADKESFGWVPTFGGCPKAIVRQFHPHTGGSRPVAGHTRVVAVLRNGEKLKECDAKTLVWTHCGAQDDIVGYYLADQPAAFTVHDEIQVTVSKPDMELLTPQQVADYVMESVIRATEPGGILRK